MYADARELFAQVLELEKEANKVDDVVRVYELAGLIFAVGLATSAWASLVGHRRPIRVIFVVVSLLCLLGVSVVISQPMLT